MNATITGGASVITPTLVTELSEANTGRNIVHRIIGRTDPDVTLRAASLRTGTLELAFLSEADSHTARNVLATGGLFTLNSPDRPTLAMKFVVADNGRISRAIEDTTRNAWTIAVDYAEVSA